MRASRSQRSKPPFLKPGNDRNGYKTTPCLTKCEQRAYSCLEVDLCCSYHILITSQDAWTCCYDDSHSQYCFVMENHSIQVDTNGKGLYPPPVGLLGLFDGPPQGGHGSAENCPSAWWLSSDQHLYFICHPRFSFRKNPDGFSHCHIVNTALNVEKNGLQVLLFEDGLICQT